MTDIYAIDVKMESILEYLKERSQSTSGMYSKTKVRYRKLMSQCEEAIKLISEILQDDLLQDNDNDSFEESDQFIRSNEVTDVLQSMKDMISQFESLSTVPENTNYRESIPVSTTNKKRLLMQYKNVIDKTNTNCDALNEKFPYLGECAYIIQQWLDARYKKGEKDFKYNLDKVPEWIRCIIITYGLHIRDRSVPQFLDTFYKWLDDIDLSPRNSKYPLPNDVWKIGTDIEDENMTLSALVLWDMLYDNGFNCLPGVDKKDYMKDYFDENCSSDVGISLLKQYRDYKDDESILYDSNLLTVMEGE